MSSFHILLAIYIYLCCSSATHYMLWTLWHQWGCQWWLQVSEGMPIFAALNMNLLYSEELVCQRCIREGLCSSDGDTEDRDMLERLRYWILLPDSWVTFQLSRGMRQRWISQSSALLSTAPPTGLRINAPFYPSAELGDASWAASPSTQVPHGSTQGKKTLQVQVVILMWTWTIKGESYELAWHKSNLSCSFALH